MPLSKHCDEPRRPGHPQSKKSQKASRRNYCLFRLASGSCIASHVLQEAFALGGKGAKDVILTAKRADHALKELRMTVLAWKVNEDETNNV